MLEEKELRAAKLKAEWWPSMSEWWPYKDQPGERDEAIFRAAFDIAQKKMGAKDFGEIARESIRVLKPDPEAAMVVVRVAGYDALTEKDFEGFDAAIKDKMRDPNLMVVFLGPMESVESLSEREMSERGWRRDR